MSLPADAEDTGSIPGPGRCHMKSVCHNYWACALESGSRNYRAHRSQLLKPVHPRGRALQLEKPPQWEAHALQVESSPHSPQLEKSSHSSEDPAQPEINKIIVARKSLKELGVAQKEHPASSDPRLAPPSSSKSQTSSRRTWVPALVSQDADITAATKDVCFSQSRR